MEIKIPKIRQFVKQKRKPVDKALKELRTATVVDIMRATGSPRSTVQQALEVLHNAGKVHIGGYELQSRNLVVKVWHWGAGFDEKEPLIVREKIQIIPRPDIAAAWLRNPI
jgi:hypothetical protein